MGSSKQLAEDLKMKIIVTHKAGEGYKKIAKHFQVAVSSGQSVIKKSQLTGMAEVKLRAGRRRKLSERTAHRISRKPNQTPRLTAKDVQEDLADSGVVEGSMNSIKYQQIPEANIALSIKKAEDEKKMVSTTGYCPYTHIRIHNRLPL